MTLEISKKNEIFYLNGRLNSSTLKSFITYFEYNLSQNKNVTINIDHVIEIDNLARIETNKILNKFF